MSSKRSDFRPPGVSSWRCVLALLGMLLGVASAFATSATVTLKNNTAGSLSYAYYYYPSFTVIASGTLAAGASTSQTLNNASQNYQFFIGSQNSSVFALATGDVTYCTQATGNFLVNCTPAPATYTNHVATAYYGNPGLISLNVALIKTAGTNAPVTVGTQTAKPGEGVQMNLTNSTDFGWKYQMTNFDGSVTVLASGNASDLVNNTALLPDVVTIAPVQTLGFTNIALPTAPSPVLPSVGTPASQANDFSSTTAGLATLNTDNQARATDLQNLLISAAAQQYRQSLGEVQAVAANATYIAQFINYQTTIQNNNAAAAQTAAAAQQTAQAATTAAITAQTTAQATQAAAAATAAAAQTAAMNAPSGSTTNVPGAPTGFGLGTNSAPIGSGALSSFLPSNPGASGDGSLSWTLPFGSLGVDGLSDHTMDFGVDPVAPWIATMRAVLLSIVTITFLLLTIRLIRQTIA